MKGKNGKINNGQYASRTALRLNKKKWMILAMLLACILSCLHSFINNGKQEDGGSSGWQHQISRFLNHSMEQKFFQIPRYLENREERADTGRFVERLIRRNFPLLEYTVLYPTEGREQEDALMAQLIGQQEGADEDVKDIDEANLDYGEDALHIDNSLFAEMEKENGLHNSEQAAESEEDGENAQIRGNAAAEAPNTAPEGVFVTPEYPSYTYDWSEKWDYEALLSNFYAVDNSTRLKEEYADLNRLLYQELSVNKEADGPQILIYHTHGSEAFIDSVPGDESTTIVGAGEKLAELLENTYGFRVLHYTERFDNVRDEAYNESLPVIRKLLDDNPTIEAVIDLHRDAVAGDRKLVMDLQGRPTARFMFFNGLSYGRKSGDIEYLENPYIQENLAFSFQVQVAANEYYPGIARKIYLKAYRYNMHLMPKSLLIEMGAQNNTVEEIMNACDPLAHILAIVLG